MKRAKHSLSHYKLVTCKMGQLIPVAWFEALPGDTIQQATSMLVRCGPLAAPPMHPVHVRIHHWFVPNRILWSNWQDYITGGPDGLNASAHPMIAFGSPAAVSSLADYLGCSTVGGSGNVNALPFRAYQMIWNEFYRDEDLQSKAPVALTDGTDSTTMTALQNVCWEKDYLTSARPWAQKGATVTLPIGTSATVRTSGTRLVAGPQTAMTAHRSDTGGNAQASSALAAEATGPGNVSSSSTNTVGPYQGVYPSNLFADLSTATAVDVNTVRHAFALQRFEEARARYGSRYTEYLRYLGVRSSDARLQRPEYLGGGRQTIQFSEVLQTGPASGGGGVGNMLGHGITAVRSNRYRRFFEEHGIVMSLMSVRPKTMYSNRIARKLYRGNGAGTGGFTGTKEDYWQRELQHIGQQAINGVEADQSAFASQQWGYQDRYDEYRREESSVHGLFRTTLNNWHLSREFATPPALNATFVSCVPSTRVFQDLTADNLYVCANHSIQARRLVARQGTSMTF